MLRNVDWTLLGQIEFGRAELRHSNCATLRTCILRFASVVHIGLGQNNRPCVHSGSLIWRSHVCCAIYERLFILLCGIFDYYIKEIRSHAEQSVPIWNSGLTQIQISDLERIQKVSLKIILGDGYKSYDLACEHFKIETLSNRRLEL